MKTIKLIRVSLVLSLSKDFLPYIIQYFRQNALDRQGGGVCILPYLILHAWATASSITIGNRI